MTGKVSALCLPSRVSQATGPGRNAPEEAGQPTGKRRGRGDQPVRRGPRLIGRHPDTGDRTVLMPADRSALWHFTWRFKNELGVQFVAKDAVDHFP